ncbi:hypothetical protein LCM4577_29880 [Mesorhizobium sp. LCM 4577]|nr:hypothetical protein LCM4577_29880 [Mesorhizobium sp. LCM 4577]
MLEFRLIGDAGSIMKDDVERPLFPVSSGFGRNAGTVKHAAKQRDFLGSEHFPAKWHRSFLKIECRRFVRF